MSIGAVSSGNPLTSALLAKGLSSDKAQLVEKDVKASIGLSGTNSSTTIDPATVRAKLDQRIADDVATGKLSEKDAALVSKALDELGGNGAAPATAEASTAAAATGANGTPPAGSGGGGGGGGSSEKTELTRTVIVTGDIATTTITYTDGTSETKTRHVDPDATPTAAGARSEAATGYTSDIEPGSLVDILA